MEEREKGNDTQQRGGIEPVAAAARTYPMGLWLYQLSYQTLQDCAHFDSQTAQITLARLQSVLQRLTHHGPEAMSDSSTASSTFLCDRTTWIS